MPLDLMKVHEKLEKKKDSFEDFNNEYLQELIDLQNLSSEVFSEDYNQIKDVLDSIEGACGAVPTEEYKDGLLIESSLNLQNLPSMIDWARTYLDHRIIAGSDGSQIYSSSDFSIPVAIVQIAYYANLHSINKEYVKENRIEVYGPDELAIENPQTNMTHYPQESVDSFRYIQEMEVISEGMEKIKKDILADYKSVLSLQDGSLILSFLQMFNPLNKERHLKALKGALNKSKNHQFPLVGYVDSSRAKDVLHMLLNIGGSSYNSLHVSDAQILEKYMTSIKGKPLCIGDRTCAFICERDDEIYGQYPKLVGHKIGFFYLKLSSGQLSRIEFPYWVLEVDGLLDEITKCLVADSIIGQGYPYTIDQTHHACVIVNKDRMKFYRLFQDFSQKNDLHFKIKNKARSKLRRK